MYKMYTKWSEYSSKSLLIISKVVNVNCVVFRQYRKSVIQTNYAALYLFYPYMGKLFR
jgi:hypothetical protein